jgi:hypothetical protein
VAALLCAPGWAAEPSQTAQAPQPGSINYVEGQAAVDGQPLSDKSVGSVRVADGGTVTTQNGRVEVLLTPGVFFRLGDQSSAQMISAGLSDTSLALQKGRAMVEVADIHDENNLRVSLQNTPVQLRKRGLYDFDADRGEIRVFDGEAVLDNGTQQIKIKGGHELSLAGPLKAHSFDKKAREDDLYRWSSLRSSYLAEANADAARRYAERTGYAPGLWDGSGWYWDPWYSAYTYIPGNGFFYNPFGWGFYSPGFIYAAPYYGFYGERHFGPAYRPHNFARRGSGFAGHPATRPGFRGGFGSGLRGNSGVHNGGIHRGGHR